MPYLIRKKSKTKPADRYSMIFTSMGNAERDSTEFLSVRMQVPSLTEKLEQTTLTIIHSNGGEKNSR